MSDSPSSPSTPTEKRFRSLKHSKTFTSLSESIRSLREAESADVPIIPRTRDVSKSSLFQFTQSPPREATKNGATPLDRSPESVYSASPISFSPTRLDDTQRSPKERFEAYVTSTGSPRSPKLASSPRADIHQDAPKSPAFLSKRAISSPIPQAKNTVPSIALPTPPTRPATSTNANQNIGASTMLTNPAALLSSNLPPATAPRPMFARTDTSQSADPDPAALVAAAGSTQAAIIQLVKDKQAALTRSEQLWRLVEKQRAMILGLNRDLEAALQEKERYRKQLKEQLVLSESGDMNTTQKIGLVDVKEESRSQSRDVNRPIGRTENGTDASQESEHLIPTSPESRATTPRSPRLRLVPSNGDVRATQSPRSPNGSHPTNPVDKARKGAPTPLNLAQTQRISTPPVLDQAILDSDSDYGDDDITESSPLPRRGRRRTRDDDDRQRDISVVEDERLARFERLKQSRSKMELMQRNAPPTFQVRAPSYKGTDMLATSNGLGLPSSTRTHVDAALPSPMPEFMGSIGSVMGGNAGLAPMTERTLSAPLMTPGLPLSPRPAGLAAMTERTLSAPLMSPGLPLSPRPGDRPPNAPQPRLAIKPVNSHPPLPHEMPLSPVCSGPYTRASLQILQADKLGMSPNPLLEDSRDVYSQPASTQPATTQMHVFRGLTSDLYPNLLLPPNALAHVHIRVDSCRLMPLRGMRVGTKDIEEEVPFTLAVCTKNDDTETRLWRVEKSYQAVVMLDQALRATLNIQEKVPDRSLFTGQAPARIDARRAALYSYFQAVLNVSHVDAPTALVISGFFSTDIRPAREEPGTSDDPGVAANTIRRKKEGYLSKKGKSFGGWKARYFVLESSDLNYFETLGGDENGTINLLNAQIARQTVSGNSDVEYRHAFMIMEQRRKESSSANRHILCAETDEDRDAWIEALLPWTESAAENENIPRPMPERATSSASKGPTNKALADIMGRNTGPKNGQGKDSRRLPLLHTVSYDSTIAAESPQLGASARTSWSPTDNASDAGSQVSSQASTVPQTSSSTTTFLPPQAQPVLKKSPNAAKKKRSIFGFRSKASDDNVPATPKLTIPTNGEHLRPRDLTKGAVFGIPLTEAAQYYSPTDIDICLPAPVYRCIEYLDVKRAAREEGIFRLSGSNTTIKALRERFNDEGDVRLLEGDYYDVHAVASLLKMYLRELPESVLTRKLHLEFLTAIDSDDKDNLKILLVNALIRKLPEANIELLSTLSRFLIEIVNKSDVNRMSVRNVGIVFSPTLNIPAPLISFFITDYAAVFAGTSSSISRTTTHTNGRNDMPSPLSPSASSFSFNSSAMSPLTPAGPEIASSPRKQYFDRPSSQGYDSGFRRVEPGVIA